MNNKIYKFLNAVYSFMLDFIFPPRCVICDEVYAKKSFKEEVHICDVCRKRIRFLDNFETRCKKCSRPIDNNSIICPACQVIRYKYDIAVASAIYEKQMRESLLSYKFSGHHYKYRTFAKLMLTELLRHSYMPKFDVIVSVPSTKKRNKHKGFAHIEPIAKYIGRSLKVRYEEKALIKIKETPPQSILTFKERFLSVKGAFRLNKNVRGKSVLLIDDIYTTGATANEISGLLKRNGAKFVAVLTLCITPSISEREKLL